MWAPAFACAPGCRGRAMLRRACKLQQEPGSSIALCASSCAWNASVRPSFTPPASTPMHGKSDRIATQTAACLVHVDSDGVVELVLRIAERKHCERDQGGQGGGVSAISMEARKDLQTVGLTFRARVRDSEYLRREF